MQESNEFRMSIARLLEDVALGRVDSAVAIDRWPRSDLEKDQLVNDAWELLMHYDLDEDIRERDKLYAESQSKEMLEYARRIVARAGPGRD